MLTAAIIRSLAPRARQDYIDALANGDATFEKYGITTPERMAAFLASCLHETGGLTILRESTLYTTPLRIAAVWPSRFTASSAAGFVRNEKKLANAVYGGRMGNERNGTNDDDGYRYRGASFMQTTGFDNFKRIGDAIGIDLGGRPELIEDANVGLQAACYEFQSFLSYCDMGERGWKSVCNGINRGNALSKLDPIGWSDRQIWYKRCCDALSITGKTADDTLRLGDQGPLVKALQERLMALRYPLGRADGIYGSRMRAAVLTFQAENALTTDGSIGLETRNALNAEGAKPMPLGERATETAADLKAAGSGTIESTDKLKGIAKGLGAVATATAATKESGVLDSAQAWLTEMTLVKTTTNGLVDIALWASGKWYIFVIVIAYFLYRWAKSIEVCRVIEHNLGINLSR